MLEQKPSIAQLVERWTVEVQIDIHRSLVQLRLEGVYSGGIRFSICPKTLMIALMRPIGDPDVTRTRNLLIWSQARYHCATESFTPYLYFICF